ncbi:MAG: InlB B-repeat-containing protein, partial [Oscillospiraceae bacterium]
YSNSYSFNGSSISDIEMYINGNESNCKTTPATGTIYIADLAAVSDDFSPVINTDNYSTFNVETNNIAYGTIISTADNGKYATGTQITITASANSGHKFLGWSKSENGDIFNTDETYTFTLSDDTVLYANFVKDEKYYLTVPKTEGCKKILISTADNINKEFEYGQYYAGNTTLEVFGEDGYTFKGWYNNSACVGDPLSTSTKYSFDLKGLTSLYPKFIKDGATEYSVEAIKTMGCSRILFTGLGSNSISFKYGSFKPGDSITLQAIGNSNYVFKAWYTNSSFRGVPVSTDELYTFKVDNNIKLYPKFEAIDGYHIFTVDCDSDFGHVEGSIGGVWPYRDNALITETAYPQSNYKFTGWTNGKYGELLSTDPEYSFNIKSDINLYAHFKHIYYHVTVDCGPYGTALQGKTGYYGKYNIITLEAKPNEEGYVFDCWKDGDGNVISTDNPYKHFNDIDNIELHAQFVKKSTKHTVKLVKGQNGTFSGSSTRTYNDGSKASITATPNEGYKFVGWKIYGTNILVSRRATYNFYVTEDVTYQPVFDKENSAVYHYLGVYSADEGGNVSKVTGYHVHGESVPIEATPKKGYRFTGWTNKAGDTVSTKSQLTVSISNSKYFYAHFEKIPYHTVELVDGAYGSFTGDYIREYLEGEKASITAVPDEGYQFVGWKIVGTNILVSRRPTYNFYVNEDVKYQPVFDETNSTSYHYLGVYAADEGGSVSKVTGYHVHGESVAIEAIPKDGYKFTGWTNKAGDTVSTKRQLTVTMSNSKYFYAHFEKISG